MKAWNSDQLLVQLHTFEIQRKVELIFGHSTTLIHQIYLSKTWDVKSRRCFGFETERSDLCLLPPKWLDCSPSHTTETGGKWKHYWQFIGRKCTFFVRNLSKLLSYFICQFLLFVTDVVLFVQYGETLSHFNPVAKCPIWTSLYY